jgi:hypothetical protein
MERKYKNTRGAGGKRFCEMPDESQDLEADHNSEN